MNNLRLKKITKLLLFFIACCLFLFGCNGIEMNNVEGDFYNAKMVQEIEDNYYSWVENTIDYNVAIENISFYKDAKDAKVVDVANQYINKIIIENHGNQLFEDAQKYFDNEEYSLAMIKVKEIDTSYSQINLANNLFDTCKKIILAKVSNPVTVKEYEVAIEYITKCSNDIYDFDFSTRRMNLINEYQILKDVIQIVENAQIEYAANNFRKSFNTLENGLKQYPENQILIDCLHGFQDLFVLDTVKEVQQLCDKKEYKTALQTLDAAQTIYNHEDFNLVVEAVKEKRNPVYKVVKDISRYYDSVSSAWETEELSVHKVAEKAGNYVVKSGKKLFLGDYSNENVTVLSFTSNVITSLAGLDFMFDIRDLSYDITHWGEEEYFVLFLAADVIALVPVIGLVKYFDFFDHTTETVKDVTKVVDNFTDMSKNANKVVDLLDELATTAKGTQKIDEVVEQATTIAKNTDETKLLIQNLRTGYPRYYQTRNYLLKGDVHQRTGIPFVERYVKYTYVDDLIAVFPKFDSKFDYVLPEELWYAADAKQFKKCNEMLYTEISTNYSLKKLFTEEEIVQLSKGDTPSRFTWHHNEEEGLMQLVEFDIHQLTGHTGGKYFWGGGSDCRTGTCLLPID